MSPRLCRCVTHSVPAGYKSGDFPALTLVSPSLTATINDIPLVVNGEPGVRLSERKLLKATREPFAIKTVEVLIDAPDANGRVTARLTGTRLSQLGPIWVNSQPLLNAITPVSDSVAMLRFQPPKEDQRWDFTATTKDDELEKRGEGHLSIQNPLRRVHESAHHFSLRTPRVNSGTSLGCFRRLL